MSPECSHESEFDAVISIKLENDHNERGDMVIGVEVFRPEIAGRLPDALRKLAGAIDTAIIKHGMETFAEKSVNEVGETLISQGGYAYGEN